MPTSRVKTDFWEDTRSGFVIEEKESTTALDYLIYGIITVVIFLVATIINVLVNDHHWSNKLFFLLLPTWGLVILGYLIQTKRKRKTT